MSISLFLTFLLSFGFSFGRHRRDTSRSPYYHFTVTEDLSADVEYAKEKSKILIRLKNSKGLKNPSSFDIMQPSEMQFYVDPVLNGVRRKTRKRDSVRKNSLRNIANRVPPLGKLLNLSSVILELEKSMESEFQEPYLRKWGLECSKNPKGICVEIGDCGEGYRIHSGKEFCAEGNYVCCASYNRIRDIIKSVNEGKPTVMRKLFNDAKLRRSSKAKNNELKKYTKSERSQLFLQNYNLLKKLTEKFLEEYSDLTGPDYGESEIKNVEDDVEYGVMYY